jgi:predicted enzyme related to lactoylglutathione lyase
MARVTHFDLIAEDVERAIAFYTEAFDWKIEKWDGPMDYWLIATGDREKDGIDGGLSQGTPNMPNGELTLRVDSLDDAVAKTVEAGGTITRERSAIPGVGWLAMIKDTEGNQFGLMQEDSHAT